jgi:conjugal transfer pilus assembly protein TraV
MKLFIRNVTFACGLALSGCSSLSGVGGSSSLSCPVPSGSSCKPIGQVYQSAPNGTPVAKGAVTAAGDAGGHAIQVAALPVAPALSPYVARLPAERVVPTTGEPIRSATRTLKIWIAPWEDEEGALRDHGFLYVMIDSGKWQIEHSRAKILREFGHTRAPKPLGSAAPAGGSTTNSSTTSSGASANSGAESASLRQPNLPSLPQLLGLPSSSTDEVKP